MNWLTRFTLLLIVISPDVASAVGDYKKADGPYPVVEVQQLVLKDSKRNKDLQLTLRAPKVADSKAFPLVVFSHGAGGDSTAFSELCGHWASYGYIVVNPTHGDSVKLRKASGETFSPLDPNLKKDIVAGVSLLDRHADVHLILDNEKSLNAAIAKAGSKAAADMGHIGMAGHSAGAMTTQTLAGAKLYTPRDRSVSFTEPRIDAFIVISGQGLGRTAYRKESWSDIKSPMLVITGSEDYSPVDDTKPETRRHPYEYAKPGDKYLVYIDGATHNSYSGKSVKTILSEKTPDNLSYITDVTTFSTLAFLDSYLKGEAEAKKYLSARDITKYPGGKLEYSTK